jgi:outer membrane protein
MLHFLSYFQTNVCSIISFLNMNIISNALLLWLLLLPLFGRGQTAAAPRTLTLDEVVQLGMANSKSLQISMAKAEVAHSKTRQVRATTIPSLTYSGSYYRLSDNVEPFETPLFVVPVLLNQTISRVSLSEPIFTGLRAFNSIHATEFLEKAARFDLEKDKKEVQLNLLTAALNLYKLQEALQVLDRSLVTAKNRMTDIQNLNKQGITLDNDVLRADLAVTQIETARLETDNAVTSSQYALATLLGLPTEQPLQIDLVAATAAVMPGSLDNFLDNATQRADYQAATQRAFASAKQVAISKGAYFPFVNVGANLYSSNPNQRQFPVEDRFITVWDAGVQLSWNLSGLYTSRFSVQESKLNLVQANILRDQMADAARTEIVSNYYSWQTALQKIALTEKSVTQSIENQRIIALRNKQQIASTTDLLDADLLLLQSQINQLSTKADAQLSYFKLLKSAGKL